MSREFVKSVFFGVKAAIRLDKLKTRNLVRHSKAAVLNLHRVSPTPSEYWPPLKPEIFESLLKYLDQNFEVRSLSELDEEQGSRPVAVLSFDDGYYDFIEYALPLLEKYKMTANMNIIPQCAETGRPIWNVRLYDFLASASKDLMEKIRINGFQQSTPSENQTSKVRFGMAISRFLKNRPRVEREQLFGPIERLMADNGFRETRMMTTDELRQLMSSVELGAHSYSHESMAFETQEFFSNDLLKCKIFFDREFGMKLKIYAFPNGSYKPEQIEYLRKEKVEKILLVDEQFADLKSDVVRRITMYGDSPFEIRMRVVGE